MPRHYKPPLFDLSVKAGDCYDPADYVMVHKDYLRDLQARARTAALHEESPAVAAVDPSAADPGTPTPRDAKSSPSFILPPTGDQ